MTSYKHKKSDTVYIQAIGLPKEVFEDYKKFAESEYSTVPMYIRKLLIQLYNGRKFRDTLNIVKR